MFGGSRLKLRLSMMVLSHDDWAILWLLRFPFDRPLNLFCLTSTHDF
jgi:hypothetical protein